MPQERLNILLIEHDSGFARYVHEMLGQARDLLAEVLSAADLHSGLLRLSASRFDVVVMDLSVPDGAGLANVSLIRAQAPQLPVIVAGEADDETVALEAVQSGAHD
ncbi:MAG TPA: response regulator, partial [Bacillota bacterium]|nr:response regulator [Bacillota bacterium]